MPTEPPEITVDQMREHAPGPWKWRVDDPGKLPPTIQQYIRDRLT